MMCLNVFECVCMQRGRHLVVETLEVVEALVSISFGLGLGHIT